MEESVTRTVVAPLGDTFPEMVECEAGLVVCPPHPFMTTPVPKMQASAAAMVVFFIPSSPLPGAA